MIRKDVHIQGNTYLQVSQESLEAQSILSAEYNELPPQVLSVPMLTPVQFDGENHKSMKPSFRNLSRLVQWWIREENDQFESMNLDFLQHFLEFEFFRN
jgi:hypothetical protein